VRLSHRWIASVLIEALIRRHLSKIQLTWLTAASVAVILECAAVAEASGDGSASGERAKDSQASAQTKIINIDTTWQLDGSLN